MVINSAQFVMEGRKKKSKMKLKTFLSWHSTQMMLDIILKVQNMQTVVAHISLMNSRNILGHKILPPKLPPVHYTNLSGDRWWAAIKLKPLGISFSFCAWVVLEILFSISSWISSKKVDPEWAKSQQSCLSRSGGLWLMWLEDTSWWSLLMKWACLLICM